MAELVSEFVPKEIAELAEIYGFDEPTFATYMVFGDGKPKDGFYGQTEPELFIDGQAPDIEDREDELQLHAYGSTRVPLYQQLTRWFKKREIFIVTKLDISDGLFKWYSGVKTIDNYELKLVFNFNAYPSEELALHEAYKEAFKLLPHARKGIRR